MRDTTDHLEEYRVKTGELRTTAADGMNGAFLIPNGRGHILTVIASDATDWPFDPTKRWEHVSVSLPARCPTWDEMSFVRDLFFKADETVMELHVARGEHISFHNYCLHLWRPLDEAIPLPPSQTVAPGG
jgi:hypothetical protein